MPVLRNQRYDEFEHSTPRDPYRGQPLQQFPWVLEEKTISTADGQLQWLLRVECLSAVPSGFGVKLNLALRATATLKTDTLATLSHAETSPQRVQTLFGDCLVELVEHLDEHFEATFDDLNKLCKPLQKKLTDRLAEQWTPERVQKQLRGRLRRVTPGGFGQPAGF